MKDFAIGFDVGGTRLKSGAVTRDGRLLAQGIAPSDAHLGPRALLERLAEEVNAIARKMKAAPRAVGIGLPGAIRPDQGIVLLPGRLKGLENFPLVSKLARATRLPVIADNDARLAMIAEYKFGAAKRESWALTVTLGTGVGSGVLLDGRILRDPHLQFGTQMSHITIQSGGRLCLTGNRGTAEMLCSATALAMQVRDGLQRGIPSVLSDRYVADPASIDFEAVMDGVRRKDRLCVDELRVWTANVATFLVSAIHVYSPEIVILGGGASHGAKYFLKDLKSQVARRLFRWPVGQTVPIVVSKIMDHAGVLGASAIAWETV